MAYNRKTPRQQAVPKDDPEPILETEESSDQVKAQVDFDVAIKQSVQVEDLLDRLNEENARIHIKEVKPTGLEVLLERVDITQVGDDLNEFVRDRYGPGKWRLYFEIKQNGKFSPYQNKTITVHDDAPKGAYFRNKEKQEQTKPQPLGDDAMSKLIDALREKGGLGGGSEMTALLFKSMQEQSALTMKMMADSQANMMTALSTMFGAIKGGGASGNQQLELLQVLKVFKELNEGGGGEKFDPMRMLEFAHKLSKEFRDRDEDEPPWVKMVPHIVSLFAPKQFPQPPIQVDAPPGTGTVAAAGQPAAVQVPPQLPGPQIQFNAQLETTPQPTDEMFAKFLPIKTLAAAILPKLISGIESGAEPEDALDMFNNPLSPVSLTDTQYDDLVDILEKDGWLKELFGEKEFSEKQTEWITRLRDLILKTEKEAPTESHEQ